MRSYSGACEKNDRRKKNTCTQYSMCDGNEDVDGDSMGTWRITEHDRTPTWLDSDAWKSPTGLCGKSQKVTGCLHGWTLMPGKTPRPSERDQRACMPSNSTQIQLRLNSNSIQTQLNLH